MAENRSHIDASPAEVWSALADGNTYADWVVGAKEIRSVDPGWPAPGAKLHHSVGAGPAKLKDNTVVLESEAPRWLKLNGRFRPIGVANISFELLPQDSGTEVVMKEVVVGGLAATFYGRLMSAAMKARNVETLRRLKNLVDERRSAG